MLQLILDNHIQIIAGVFWIYQCINIYNYLFKIDRDLNIELIPAYYEVMSKRSKRAL